MEDHYGMADLRHFITNPSLYASVPPPPPPFPPPQQAAEMLSAHHYGMAMVAPPRLGLHHEFLADSTTNAASAATTTASGGGGASSGGAGFSGFELEAGSGGRWPRQETLTLLEIRSRLDSKFKEANQKGPLWDELSRIMSEEYGYQRSGKKCREKFENLYKYYKKTKDGNAGRQDGKHYRFFRQLEALYGETNNSSTTIPNTHQQLQNTFYCNKANCVSVAGTDNNNNNQETAFLIRQPSNSSLLLSLSNSSDSETNSSPGGESSRGTGKMNNKRKGKRRNWKSKIKDFIDKKMKKLMEKQESWLERIMASIEQKEHERMLREEEWRKQEAARTERERKFWANERAWIEARDAALLESLQKISGGKEMIPRGRESGFEEDDWAESEITKLMQLRSNMESRFQQHKNVGCSDDVLWEEIANKMCCIGYDNNGNNNNINGAICRDKWIGINNYLIKCNNKRSRKENSSGNCFNHNLHNNNNGHGGSYSAHEQQHQQQRQHSNASLNQGGFRSFLMGDNNINAENLW